MIIIALDTSSVACSVALGLEDAVFERHTVLPKEHTRLLMPMIEALWLRAGPFMHPLQHGLERKGQQRLAGKS